MKEFESWKQVPPNLKSKKQWLRSGRRVQKDAQPVARVTYPVLVDRPAYFCEGLTILEECGDTTLVSSSEPTLLFGIAQTVDYRPSARTRAYWEFEDIFFKHMRHDCWIRKTDLSNGKELDDWRTETESPFVLKSHLRNCLTEELVRKHINQKHIIGVKGHKLTRFVIVDLDFHGRDLDVFLRQAAIVLDRFLGLGTWHCQMKNTDVSGLQLIYVFDKPKEIAAVHQELRAILAELDGQYAELVAAAKAVGMKSLAEVEIYPTISGNGVRLPLCRDRIMFLDRKLDLVQHRKRQVQDVEGYMRWINDPNRQYVAKQEILDHIREFAASSRPASTSNPEYQPRPQTANNQHWKGNLRRWLYEFWIGGEANGRSLNEHITVLARLAAVQGYTEKEIHAGICTFVKNLPAAAASCSSRLLKGERRKIEAVIASTAKYVCETNGHQRDPKNSTDVLGAALMEWRGFDALDISTWSKPEERTAVVPYWSDEQRSRFCAFFRRPLFVKDDDLIIRFINGIVNLTLTKEKQGHGWGKEYLLKWMKTQFPNIRCAKDQKRHRIMRCLEEEGIIAPIARGKAGMYATRWTLGKEARKALGIVENEECSSISTEASNSSIYTSTYYSSLFSGELTCEWDQQDLSLEFVFRKPQQPDTNEAFESFRLVETDLNVQKTMEAATSEEIGT